MERLPHLTKEKVQDLTCTSFMGQLLVFPGFGSDFGFMTH
jgi:hypothetical protein